MGGVLMCGWFGQNVFYNPILLSSQLGVKIQDRAVRHNEYVIVHFGPKLQSSAQVLAQSEHYIQGGIHHPPTTTNFLKNSRHIGRLRFCTQASYMLSN